LQVYGVKVPTVKPGDDLVSLAIDRSNLAGTPLRGGDIVVFSAKAIGASEGRLVRLSEVKPSEKAVLLAGKFDLEPAFAEVVVRESDAILGGVRHALLTLKRGILIANGGADNSNAPVGYAALWPRDPQKSAEALREAFRGRGIDAAVLVTDSRTLPLRMGSSAVAIGVSGFAPVEDLRGRPDLYGRPMKVKRSAVADDLASAARLVMGETSESVPIAIVRGAPVTFGEGHTIEEALIPAEQCLIMHALRFEYR